MTEEYWQQWKKKRDMTTNHFWQGVSCLISDPVIATRWNQKGRDQGQAPRWALCDL